MKLKLSLLLACAILIGAPLLAVSTPKKAPAEKEQTPAETGYWLTIKSGIRHNTKCRYYKNSQGKPCAKDEGRACKICGG